MSGSHKTSFKDKITYLPLNRKAGCKTLKTQQRPSSVIISRNRSEQFFTDEPIEQESNIREHGWAC